MLKQTKRKKTNLKAHNNKQANKKQKLQPQNKKLAKQTKERNKNK